MTATEDAAKRHAKRRFTMFSGLLGVALGLFAVYGISAFLGNPPADAGCRPAIEKARQIAPLARGEVAALMVADKPVRVPDLAFQDASGRQKHLADWNGRTVLLNLWATWCVPCRKEMPALDVLQAALGSSSFEVVAINIDTRDPDKPRTWLQEIGISRLVYYADPTAKVFQDLKVIGRAFGMPTTLLVNPGGCEIGAMAGPAEWASPDGMKLVQASLEQ